MYEYQKLNWKYAQLLAQKNPLIGGDLNILKIEQLLGVQIVLNLVVQYDFFFEGVCARLIRFDSLYHLCVVLSTALFFQGRYHFLCHFLFDLFVNGYFFEDRVEFLQLYSFRSVLTVFCGDVARGASYTRVFMLGAFQYYLYAVSFLGHR